MSDDAETRVEVNAKLTTKDEVQGDEQNKKTENLDSGAKLESAMQRITQLESELKSVNTEMDCKIHGEFDAIRRYVDRAIEHDRLKKRP
ncbi:hypothetical protein [Marinomonas balearica]|uniref:Uncharacterized protein n=1 Tax=Marinomonas balearica TaxID=491947 RepID=A0A4R6M762_9GAMM|nr:hypothetical protein [Marinomonas balearica]TDO96695.1 hypothetical protein DFP79_2458 [Marinomonas balearica]